MNETGLVVAYRVPYIPGNRIKTREAVEDELCNLADQGLRVVADLSEIGGWNSPYLSALTRVASRFRKNGRLEDFCLCSPTDEFKKSLDIARFNQEVANGMLKVYGSVEEALVDIYGGTAPNYSIGLTPNIFNPNEQIARVRLTPDITSEDVDNLLTFIWFYKPLDNYRIFVTLPRSPPHDKKTKPLLAIARQELRRKGITLKLGKEGDEQTEVEMIPFENVA